MGPLLLPLPVLAIVLAGLDVLLVRWAQPWRGGGPGLFFHAYFLWACFGIVALLPSALTLRFLDRRSRPWPARGWDARPWIVMLGWTVLPVVAEAMLDAHTSLVGMQGLGHVRPWLELGGALASACLALAVLGRSLGALSGVRIAALGVTLALAVGLFPSARAATAPPASATGRPNLLLLVLDTCRSDKLEAYGHARPTSPGLAALAEESLVFEDSVSVASFTFSSHLSLLTGVHPGTHGAHLLDMRFDPERATSIATVLQEAGYRTGAFVGTDVLAARTGIRAGFDVYDDQVDPPVCDTFAWGFVHAVQSLVAELVPALRFNGRPHWIQDFQRPADEALGRARAWIGNGDPRPWFCFVNLYDVHWPYLPEGAGHAELVRPYDGPVDGFLFRSDRWRDGYRMEEADKRHVNDLYEGEVLDLDAVVTGFLGELELARGGTAVLVTADHGEGLGEGDTWNHDDVREPQVRVPFILRLPEAETRGARVQAPVSGVDVAPTLLALAGLDAPAGVEGRNLLACLDEAPAEDHERWIEDRDHLRAEDFRWALYRGAFKLVRLGAGAGAGHELYDLGRDPAGFTDVAAEHPELFTELVRRMEARVGAAARPDAGNSATDSAEALQALGYAGE